VCSRLASVGLRAAPAGSGRPPCDDQGFWTTRRKQGAPSITRSVFAARLSRAPSRRRRAPQTACYDEGLTHPSTISWILLSLAALVGGAANALAGGGMFLVFPALLFAGVPPVIANATATFVLNPGGYASTWVYRDRLVHGLRFQGSLVLAAMLGAGIGSELLLHTSEQGFERLVPYLMLAAALIFTFSKWLRRAAESHAAHATHLAALAGGQFLIAIYGGYFGAGMGVLILVLYTVAANMDVHQASGLRILCGTLTNTVATVIFAVRGIVEWRLAIPMTLACIVGGYFGAHLVKRMDPERARGAILAYAWTVTIWLLARSLRQ